MEPRFISLIDFSLYSQALLELGNQWGRIIDAELLLVHRITEIVPAMADRGFKLKVVESDKQRALDKLINLVRDKISPSVRVNYLVTEKNLLSVLKELLEQDRENIIMVGLRGTGMLKKLLFGSIATQVIEDLNHTTVAVPEKLCSTKGARCHFIPKKIVVSLSYKYPFNESAFLSFLTSFGKATEHIEFITVVQSEETEEESLTYLASLSSKYKDHAFTSHRVFIGNNVFDELTSYLTGTEDTFLMVQKGSRDLSDMLFRKYLINQLMDDGSVPLISLPTNETD